MNLKNIDEAWLNLDGVKESDLINPFDLVKFNEDDVQYRILWLMTRPEYFLFYASTYLILTFYLHRHCFYVRCGTEDFMLIANEVLVNLCASLYAMIRALVLPERKVVIVGAAFRQSKVLEYMETHGITHQY